MSALPADAWQGMAWHGLTHQTTPYAPLPMGLMGRYRAGHSNKDPQTCMQSGRAHATREGIHQGPMLTRN